MDGAYNTRWKNEKCVRNFDLEARREELLLDTYA
jgi:hypothetical protein